MTCCCASCSAPGGTAGRINPQSHRCPASPPLTGSSRPPPPGCSGIIDALRTADQERDTVDELDDEYWEGTRALHEGRLSDALAAFGRVPASASCATQAK